MYRARHRKPSFVYQKNFLVFVFRSYFIFWNKNHKYMRTVREHHATTSLRLSGSMICRILVDSDTGELQAVAHVTLCRVQNLVVV